MLTDFHNFTSVERELGFQQKLCNFFMDHGVHFQSRKNLKDT